MRAEPDYDALRNTAHALRGDILRMIGAAGSGHPGGSLSAIDMVTYLYFHRMRIDPARPEWAERDRFVLSKGHCAPAWYVALAHRGYFPREDLLRLRDIESPLQGHPDMRKTLGVDMTTGSLGQGFSAAAGIALGLKVPGIEARVYAMLSDGELQEGIVWEAAMAAARGKAARDRGGDGEGERRAVDGGSGRLAQSGRSAERRRGERAAGRVGRSAEMSQPNRVVYGKTLVELGERDPRVVVFEADIAKSTNTWRFGKRFPERFFHCGAAEMNMMCLAAGAATTGLIPFASTFVVFASMRACEAVRQSICYPRLNVKIVATNAGVEICGDGPSHQGVEDLAILRTFPNLTMLSPSDPVTTRLATMAAWEMKGPVYIRLGRQPAAVLHTEDVEFRIGKMIRLREGRDVTLIATGNMVEQALLAAGELEREGVQARVLDCHTIKPIDRGEIVQAAEETGCIVTAEDKLAELPERLHAVFHGRPGATVFLDGEAELEYGEVARVIA